MLFQRTEHDQKKGRENLQWIDYNFEILLAYNTRNIRSATGLVPAEARKPKNEVKATLNMTIKATMTRQYPELEVGSQVKVMRKKAITQKERCSHWNKKIKKIRKMKLNLDKNITVWMVIL